MKIRIRRVNAPCETEISIICSDSPDEETRSLIRRLRLWEKEVIGYKDGEAHKLSLQDIFYIECVDEKIFFYLEQRVYETQQKLYEWEEQLEDTSFVRVSKSTILNTEKLRSVRPLLGGKMEATMVNGEKLIISRHYLPGFRRKFGI